jgi:hypothetical protein
METNFLQLIRLVKSGTFFYNQNTTDYYQLSAKRLGVTNTFLCRNLRTMNLEVFVVSLVVSRQDDIRGIGVFLECSTENKRVYYNLDLC